MAMKESASGRARWERNSLHETLPRFWRLVFPISANATIQKDSALFCCSLLSRRLDDRVYCRDHSLHHEVTACYLSSKAQKDTPSEPS